MANLRIQNFMFEFNSVLDPVEDAYDFGLEAQKFDDIQPFSLNYIWDGQMEVLYFTDSYVLEYVADLVFCQIVEESDLSSDFFDGLCFHVENKWA